VECVTRHDLGMPQCASSWGCDSGDGYDRNGPNGLKRTSGEESRRRRIMTEAVRVRWSRQVRHTGYEYNESPIVIFGPPQPR
jgi:hypothetical protein